VGKSRQSSRNRDATVSLGYNFLRGEQCVANSEHDARAAVEITRILERGKTARWGIVGLVVTACVWVISNAVISITQSDDPPWLKLSLAILAAVSSLLAGHSPGLLVLRWARKKIARYASRKEQLEQSVDPNRSSSQLRKDGTLPND
jgi:hypothetical protein